MEDNEDGSRQNGNRDADERFDGVYEGKFDLEDDAERPEIHGVTPGDSRALDELVDGVDPEDVDIEGMIDVGISYIEINRFEQAIETFERALRFDEENQEIWVNKGFAHSEMEEFDQAIGAHKEAVKIDDSTPEAAMAYTNMAYAEYEMGRDEEALEHVEKALDIDERLPEAWYNRGYFLNERGQHEKALRSLNNAISLGLRNVMLLEQKARALEELERYDEAEELRQEAEERREEQMREAMTE